MTLPSGAIAPCRRQHAVGRRELGAGEVLDPRPAAAREHARERRLLAVDDQPARRAARCARGDGTGSRSRPGREDVGVVVLEVVEDPPCAADSGRTSSACRRTRCRTRRPRSRRTRCRRAAPTRRSCAARRRSGIRGRGPVRSRIHASIDAVVVLPWVPATASTHLSASTFSYEPLRARRSYGAPGSRIASTSGLPRVTTLPITKRSASFATSSSCAGVIALGELDAEPAQLRRSSADRPARRSRSPCGRRSRAIAARPPMKVPQMPRMWRCMRAGSGSKRRARCHGRRRARPRDRECSAPGSRPSPPRISGRPRRPPSPAARGPSPARPRAPRTRPRRRRRGREGPGAAG